MSIFKFSSIYVYGRAGTQEDKEKELSCTKIDKVYPLQNYIEKEIDATVVEVVAAAIQTNNEARKNIEVPLMVYFVCDGERYIPKVKVISDYSTKTVQRIYQMINNLPRKILFLNKS